ncbi:MAG: YdeI family protein [Gemmatimonadaceae bacterium]
MPKRDPRVDLYIAKSQDFAKPILTHLRKVVHAACPDVEETIKWGVPSFMYNGMLCGMAAFKNHCGFVLWKGSLILDKKGQRGDEAMGHLGKLTSVADLPSDRVLTGYIKEAMRLNETGVKVPKRPLKKKKPIPMPLVLRRALQKNPKARAAFDAFSPSHKYEYLEWITDAKTDETRQRRVDTAIDWMAEGKPRNWKYTKRI